MGTAPHASSYAPDTATAVTQGDLISKSSKSEISSPVPKAQSRRGPRRSFRNPLCRHRASPSPERSAAPGAVPRPPLSRRFATSVFAPRGPTAVPVFCHRCPLPLTLDALRVSHGRRSRTSPLCVVSGHVPIFLSRDSRVASWSWPPRTARLWTSLCTSLGT